MIGKHLFWDRSIVTDTLAVVHEVMDYVDDQSKKGVLRSDFYDSTLLLIAEILPYVEAQDPWTDLGYRICRSFKASMETDGYQRQTSVFGGFTSKCFAVNAFCQQANILPSFARSMNQMLFFNLEERLKRFPTAPVRDSNHDLISGVSNTLYYLLDFENSQEEKRILIRCLEYLVGLTRDTVYHGKPIIAFHVLQPNQNPNFDQELFHDGNLNFGLAHGMLGPLIAMAKAYSMGIVVAGLREGIERIYHLYETYQLVDAENIPHWPGTMTVEEYWEGACKPEHLHSCSSWCYGNVGIIRGLQKVATYMGWKQKESHYINAMKSLLAQDSAKYNLFSPSICHGFSSLVFLQTCAYASYRDRGLLTNLERNVRQLITEYKRSNEREVNIQDILDQKVWVEGYLGELSLLTGSIGVAITLLSLRGSTRTSKLLMID